MDRLPLKRRRLGNVPIQRHGNPNVGKWHESGGVFTQEFLRPSQVKGQKIGELFYNYLYLFFVVNVIISMLY